MSVAPPEHKRLTRNQRLQRKAVRLIAAIDDLEDFAAGLLAIIDALAKERLSPRAQAILRGVDEKRKELGFPAGGTDE